MSQDFINDLPTELLFAVFDYLCHKRQLLLKLVCVRWSAVLTSDRYLVRHRLRLHPDVMPLQHCSESFDRYRAFTVVESWYRDESEIEKIRRYILGTEVVERLEELCLTLYRYSWTQFFAPQDVILFPKLQKIIFALRMVDGNFEDQRAHRIVLPNIKQIVLQNVYSTISQPAHLYSEQIETLNIAFSDKVALLAIVKNHPFVHLRNLSLKSYQRDIFMERDFNETFQETLSRLTFLEIDDEKGVFTPSFKCILRVATNLQKLIIYGVEMSEDAFNELNKLRKIRELCLMVEIVNRTSVRKLCLPELRKLTTFAGSLVPLQNVPNLKSLTIKNHSFLRAKGQAVEEAELVAYFRMFTKQLEKLKLSCLFFDPRLLKPICDLTNLKLLEMHMVEMKADFIRSILKSQKELQSIRFNWCIVADEYGDAVVTPPPGNGKDKRKRSSTGLNGFIDELSALFVDYRISYDNSRYTKSIPAKNYWYCLDLRDVYL